MIRKKTRLFLAATTLVAAGLVTTLGGTTSAAPGDPVFQGLTPARLLDTRSGPGIATTDGQFLGGGAVGAGSTLNLTVTNRGGVPASGVAAVALNVTVDQPTNSSYITAFPTGSDRPTASNLNMTPGQTIANMVIVPVGTNGQISLFNFSGSTHLIADVLGWFPANGVTGLTPARLLDTRADGTTIDGLFQREGAVGPNTVKTLTVAGRGLVPSGATAGSVALNVTATEPTGNSFITVFPAGSTQPTASNLNVVPGQTVPNMVIVPLGTAGQISLYNQSGNTHLIVDVLAWFPSATASITGVNPARLLETRSGLSTVDNRFNATGKFGPGGTQSVTVVGRGGVPASGVAAVALNVTATGGTNGSFLTVYPKGATRPNASNLNFTAGQNVPNMVMLPVGNDGQVTIYNLAGSTDVIVDVLAWFPDNSVTPTTTTTTTVPSITAPITRVSTRTGGAQGTPVADGTTTNQAGNPLFFIPADTRANGLNDPTFYYSEGPAISSNGRYVAFMTFQQLVPEDTEDVADVYRKDLQTGTVELISQTSAETAGGTASATEPAISADGNLVVFQSSQTGLDGTDNNGGGYDVFIRNVSAGTTTRLTSGNGPSTYPDISDDGTFVTFQSAASDIIVGDTNSAQDGFLLQINPATSAIVAGPTRITVTAAGAQAVCAPGCNNGNPNGFIGSFDMRISNNGEVIVFSSDADNLVAGDTNGERDVFLVRRGTPTSIERISVTSSETQVFGGTSDDAEPSADGNLVVFHSRGNNLATGDQEDGFEVYVRDVTNGNTTVLPGGNGAGNHPMISGDGNYISFGSTSASLVSGDDNGESDVFLYSRITQATTRVSVTATGATNGNGRSVESTISADGDKIAFISLSSNIVPSNGDTNGVADIFVYDRP
jgi:Tol biopolymer transport system component